MRIVHVISSLRRGGRERQLSIILNQSDTSNYHSKFICFNQVPSNYIKEYFLEDKAIYLETAGFKSRIIELHKILKDEKPDVVYTWGNLESILILLLNPFHSFIFINGSIRHGIRSPRFSHYFRTLILLLSRNVVSNSKAGLIANKLSHGHVLYNGIEDRFINKMPRNDKLLKRSKLLKEKGNLNLLISVANLVPYKDYTTILYSLKNIKENGFAFYYLILGDGPERNKIVKRIFELGLKEDVRIVGNVRNVHEYLQIADILIHSSKGEGCSNAILEGMAAGLPIIASATGGTTELVNSKNGRLFNYKNDNQLQICLEELLTNETLRNYLGENARETIRANFSVRQMLNSYYKIIEENIHK